jgi:electron transfer flavoprotein alpha subunit
MSNVLVVIGPATSPLRKGDLAAVGFAGAASEASGGAFDLLLLGPEAVSASADASKLGARGVYTLSSDELASFTAEAYSAAIAAFLDARDYRLIAATTSSASKEYVPRLAALIDAPMASDVLAIESIGADAAVFTRAVFVGNLLASVELSGPRALVTCRGSEFAAPASTDAASPVEAVTLEGCAPSVTKTVEALHQAKSERPDLKEADKIVSVGRGTRGPDEGIPLCAELADILGAAVGSTRAVVDAGWLPNELQVGQTGKIVAPDLYVAIGLSGSIQHLAGMRNSKTIVAINKDPEAPIFEVADFGLVADLFDAVPALTEAIRSRKS